MSASDVSILIVDDNETNLNLLSRYLLRLGGFKIMTAQNGSAALSMIQSNDLDLVLLDLVMPDMDGAEVLEKTRQKFSLYELPVIMLTASHENEAAVETFQKGANDYVVKPIDIKILKARLDTQIKLKKNTVAYQDIQKKLEKLVEERTAKLDMLNDALDKERRYFEYLLSASPSMIYVCDTGNNYTCSFASQNLENITGYKPEQMMSGNTFWVDHIHPKDLKKSIIKIGRNIKSGKGAVEYRFRDTNGQYRWIYDTHRVISFEGMPDNVIGSWTDITDIKNLKDEMQYKDRFNELTGLINRNEFENRLQILLEEASAETGQHVICYMDIDQFKVINNSYGHIAGDELLKQFSSCLAGKVSKRDVFAYMGGDEFALLLPHCTVNQAMSLLQNIQRTIREFRLEWEGKKHAVTISIGVVPVNRYSGSASEILASADSACYAAKESGRDRIHLYSPEDRYFSRRQEEMRWVETINRALEEDRFLLYFQPIVSLNSKFRDVHFELLLRMKDEKGELILPRQFLPAAEQYNLTSKIDWWVIQTTFSWLEVYSDLFSGNYRWGINLSGQSLSDSNLLQFVIREIDNRNIPPDKIYFEITETSAIANFSNAVEFVTKLKKYGCEFALDDFGSGLSSFAYLKNIPVDYLKIDGIFVKDIVTSEFDRSIVKSVNEVAHTLGIKTIAEYVESTEILEKLTSIGVDFGQGYAIRKPMQLTEKNVREYISAANMINSSGPN